MRTFLCIVTLFTALVVNAKQVKAPEASMHWLSLIDNGDYAESWQLADKIFQSQLTIGKWEVALNNARAPLGDVKSRVALGEKAFTSLPGVEDGEYVVLQFKTDFEFKKEAIETLTLTKTDGQWRAIGYFIK